MGDLSPKAMVSRRAKGRRKKYQKSLNRGVHNTGHLGRFIELLTYKARKIGKRVTVIDERATTRTCAVCEFKKARVPLFEHIYYCEVCGIVLDRDQNAAINIMKRFLSQHALWMGYQYFISRIDNLRHTVKDKTKVLPYLVDNGFHELVESSLL